MIDFEDKEPKPGIGIGEWAFAAFVSAMALLDYTGMIETALD